MLTSLGRGCHSCGDLEFTAVALAKLQERQRELESIATDGVVSTADLIRSTHAQRTMLSEFAAAWRHDRRAVSTTSMFLTAARVGETVLKHLQQVSCRLYVGGGSSSGGVGVAAAD